MNQIIFISHKTEINAKLSDFPCLYFIILYLYFYIFSALIFVCLCCSSLCSFPHSALAFPNVAAYITVDLDWISEVYPFTHGFALRSVFTHRWNLLE